MIFNVEGHIDQIIKGTKTQTRRASERYQVGKLYTLQIGRGERADPRGRILITRQWSEVYPDCWPVLIADALAEGGYTPDEYEKLYHKIHPWWSTRWAYEFEFWSTESIRSLKQSLKDARTKLSTLYFPSQEETRKRTQP